MKGLFSAPGDYVHFKSQVPLHKIPIGTKQWRYYDFGPREVPPLICLPGIAGTADVYYKQIMSLSMKGYRVISVDIPRVWNHREWIQAFEKFLDVVDVHHIHLYGTSLGGFLAQLFAQHRPRRVRSLILSNTFLDTSSFAAAMPWAPVVSWTPAFLLKRFVLTGIRDGPHEPFIADSVDFVVSQVEALLREDLASRLTLNVDDASVGSLQLSDLNITIMDTNDYCAIPQQLKDQLSERYPEARRAHLKTGGDFPFLSRPDEVNLHIQLHLRRVGVEARPDLVRGAPRSDSGGSLDEKKDEKEDPDPDDEPKEEGGTSEDPFGESQSPSAPESSGSHNTTDYPPLNTAELWDELKRQEDMLSTEILLHCTQEEGTVSDITISPDPDLSTNLQSRSDTIVSLHPDSFTTISPDPDLPTNPQSTSDATIFPDPDLSTNPQSSSDTTISPDPDLLVTISADPGLSTNLQSRSDATISPEPDLSAVNSPVLDLSTAISLDLDLSAPISLGTDSSTAFSLDPDSSATISPGPDLSTNPQSRLDTIISLDPDLSVIISPDPDLSTNPQSKADEIISPDPDSSATISLDLDLSTNPQSRLDATISPDLDSSVTISPDLDLSTNPQSRSDVIISPDPDLSTSLQSRSDMTIFSDPAQSRWDAAISPDPDLPTSPQSKLNETIFPDPDLFTNPQSKSDVTISPNLDLSTNPQRRLDATISSDFDLSINLQSRSEDIISPIFDLSTSPQSMLDVTISLDPNLSTSPQSKLDSTISPDLDLSTNP